MHGSDDTLGAGGLRVGDLREVDAAVAGELRGHLFPRHKVAAVAHLPRELVRHFRDGSRFVDGD